MTDYPTSLRIGFVKIGTRNSSFATSFRYFNKKLKQLNIHIFPSSMIFSTEQKLSNSKKTSKSCDNISISLRIASNRVCLFNHGFMNTVWINMYLRVFHVYAFLLPPHLNQHSFILPKLNQIQDSDFTKSESIPWQILRWIQILICLPFKFLNTILDEPKFFFSFY